APRWVGRRAVIAGRAALAGVQRETNGAQLVPSAQREHRARIPGAPEPRRSGGRTGALLHERRAGARALRPRTRRGAAPGARTVRSARPPARRPPAPRGRRWRRVAPRQLRHQPWCAEWGSTEDLTIGGRPPSADRALGGIARR